MHFATFFKLSNGYVPGSAPPRYSREHVKPIEALGGDGVCVFDGRYSERRCVEIARDVCRKRGYVGFRLERGERFSTASVSRAYEAVK